MLKRLKLLREKEGISQRALAEAVGVSQQSINKYENHNVEPDIATLILLAKHFNTSVDYLIGHSEVDHRLESLQPCELNAEELEFLQCWRSMNAQQREALRLIMGMITK